MLKIKINAQEHLVHPLRVHALLNDFKLEDVWRVPVKLTSEQSLQLFMDQFNNSTDEVLISGMAGFLFRLRIFIGKLFNWDEKPKYHRLLPGSIRFRYGQEEVLTFEDLPDPGVRDFIPVYQLENEYLSEIENKTVHAALHFSRVPIREGEWGMHMAVYVKPKGLFGKLYMLLIKPFRLWIVYPAIMETARKKWKRYLDTEHIT